MIEVKNLNVFYGKNEILKDMPVIEANDGTVHIKGY